MDKPKISILISAYNAEKYLAECIQSVLNQNYDSYELIIVNDGSTDGTLDICKSYRVENIFYFLMLMIAMRKMHLIILMYF